MQILRNLEALVGANSVKATQTSNDEAECTCGLFLEGLYREDLAPQIVAALVGNGSFSSFHSMLFRYGNEKLIQGQTIVSWITGCPSCLNFLVELANITDRTFSDLGDEA